ncbi:hypothetical protein [Sphingobacterium kitahiroshimense]|uniref:Immunity protein 22 of polymorphic toxin system n=1 Tax=Sphingobacterium kitahiroshimense TaxID=470446 RepID=A0ABV0BZX4_9SPHI
MSWDIVLFNSKQKITDLEEIQEDLLIDTDFFTPIQSYFKRIEVKDNCSTIIGDGFEIDYFVDDKLSSNELLHLYGENAIYEMIQLAKLQGWQIYDSGLDGMIDLNNPSHNGYNRFNEYVDEVLKKSD